MQILMQQGDYICAHLTAPDDYELYERAQQLCTADKLINPSVDDGSASKTYQRAKLNPNYWREAFESQDTASFVILKNHQKGGGADIVGVSAVVMPDEGNNYPAPLLCNAHILYRYRGLGLAHMLTNSSIQLIQQQGGYKDVHVIAHKNNTASIATIRKKGFMVQKRGETYIRFRAPLTLLLRHNPSSGRHKNTLKLTG